MATITPTQGREMAEYIFLTGFSKKATLEIMSGPIKEHLLKEGYDIDAKAESEWFDPDHEYSKWSTKFGRGMTYLGNPIDASQVISFRKMQPLIVASGSKSKNPAGLKIAGFKGVKKEVLNNIEKIAEGEKFEEVDVIPEEEGSDEKDSTITPQVAVSIPGSVPTLTHTRQLRKRTYPEDGKLPAGSDTIIVTMTAAENLVKDVATSRVIQRKCPNWSQPSLILMFTQGETVKYTFDNTNEIYELISGGKAIKYEGGFVFLSEFKQDPKSADGFDAKLSSGSFTISPSGGIQYFFHPKLLLAEGTPMADGKRLAPIVGFPIPDLTTTSVDNVDLLFDLESYINDPSSRLNWYPINRAAYTPLADGTIQNPEKWVPLYNKVEKIAWSADGLAGANDKYLQPLPFDASTATELDLSNQYISVDMTVDAATDIYTGYDWKAPLTSQGTLIFPGDERNLIPIVRTDPDKEGEEVKIKGAARGNAIKKILVANGQARIEVDGGHFMIPDETGDGTFYAIDNTSGRMADGKKQELKARIKGVTIQDYGAGATPDDTWNNMKKARRYKNLASSILIAGTDGPGQTCSVCGLENVVAPCALEGCPMPTESEVGVASLGYTTKEASGTYLVLLVPDEDDPSNTYEIRMTVRN